MAPPAQAVLRRGILAVFLLGSTGSLVELILLGHYEDLDQFIPLVLLGGGLLLAAWMSLSTSRLAGRAFQGTMALFIVAGLTGMGLHFQANREFQLEVNPSLAGWPLVLKSLQAKSPPALAPGVMVQFGLLGLAYTYRHPNLDDDRPA